MSRIAGLSAGWITRLGLLLLLVFGFGLIWFGNGISRDNGTDTGSRISAVKLRQNHPNPFNPRTLIPFSLDRNTRVTLAVFDVNDRYLTTLIDRELAPGSYAACWDGRDRFGKAVNAGVYYYKLRAEDTFAQRKAIVMR